MFMLHTRSHVDMNGQPRFLRKLHILEVVFLSTSGRMRAAG